MTFPRCLLVVVLCGVGSLPGIAQKAGSSISLLPVLPPIADADPAVREEREILVPAGFSAARVRDKLVLYEELLEPLKLMVGKKMALGMSTKTYVYPEGKPRPKDFLRGSQQGFLQKPRPVLTGFFTSAGDPGLFTDPDGALRPGTRCVIEVSCEIFETDIPGQHAWSPENGKYKVLWQTTLRQTVAEMDRLPESFRKAMEPATESQRSPRPLPSK